METRSGLVKNVSVRTVMIFEDGYNRGWILVTTQTGDAILIEPSTGKTFVINVVGGGNIYTKGMAVKGHDYIVLHDTDVGVPLVFVDGEYGGFKVIDMDSEMNSYINYGRAASAQNAGSIGRLHPSGDNKLYCNTFRYRDIFGATVIDPADWSITRLNMMPLPDYTHAQARWDIKCTKIISPTHPSLDGVYVDWPYDDSAPPVWFIPTLETEIGSTAFSYDPGHIMLHWEDRNPISSTRRVIAKLDGSVKVVDLKNPATYLVNNQTSGIGFYEYLTLYSWQDETSTVRTPTVENNTFPTYATELGESVPTMDGSIHYGHQFVYGSFLYAGFSYSSGKNYFQVYVTDPPTGDVVWIDSYDPYLNFANNGQEIQPALVDFGQAKYGYAVGTNEVAFIQRRDGENLIWGFIRPDTNAFVDYDFSTNPNGYTITTVRLNNPEDPNSWFSFRANSEAPLEILSDTKEYFVQSKLNGNESSRIQVAVENDFMTMINADTNTGSVVFNVLDDLSDPDRVYKVEVPHLMTTNGVLGYVLQVNSSKVFVAGIVYAGIVEYDFTAPNTWEIVNTFGEFLSMRGAKEITSDYVMYHGYLGTTHLLNTSTSVKTIIDTSTMGRADDGCKFSDTYAIISGGLVRNNTYRGQVNGRTGIIKITDLSYLDFPDMPDDFNYQLIESTRSLIGLTLDTYTQAEADAICDQYELDTGTSRSDTITLLKSLGDSEIIGLCSYTYSSSVRIIWSMKYMGWIGFRDFELSDGASGVVTAYDDDALYYPKLRVYDGGADLESSVASDFKEIIVDAVPQGQALIGRCFSTDDYIFFTLNFNDGFEQDFVATASQTFFGFSGGDSKQITSDDIIEVRKNTVLLTEGVDWDRNTGSNGIDLTSPATLSDDINVKVFDRATMYVCSITDFESAKSSGTLSSFTKKLHVKLDSFSDSSYGWGIGGVNASSTQGQDFVTSTGNIVFVSVKHPISGYVPLVYRVDLTDATLTADTIVETSSSISAVLSYYSTDDRLWLGHDNNVSYLDSVSTISSPDQIN